MNEWWLLGVLVSLTLISMALFIAPLRRVSRASLVLVPLFLIFIATSYYYWGGFSAWRQFIHKQESQQLAKQMLKSLKSPQELIDKLHAKLDDTPNSAKGWYLLGRLYVNQNDNQKALEAFAKAHQLKPEEEQFAVNYAHSLWMANQQEFNPQIKAIFNQLLNKNPNQPDALAMLAMESYQRQAFTEAIAYWQRLLAIAPSQSEEAKAIRRAIAKAEGQI